MKLSLRAQNLKPSPTLAIAAKAKALKAQGIDVISLSVGEPDWDTYEPIKRAGVQAIEQGHTKYAPAAGTPQLKKTIAQLATKEVGLDFTSDQVTVSIGAKFILFAALQMLIDEGDEVLIPIPYWVSYPTMAELAGGKSVLVPSDEKTKFHLSGKSLEKAITQKSKVLILNSPNNPSGEVLTKEELLEIAEVLRRHPQITVLSDDIYNRLIFEGDEIVAPHLLQVAPDLKDRVVLINGVSKSFSMTGWRLGWAVGPKALVDAMSNYQSQSVSCASPFTQVASQFAIENCFELVKSSNKTLIQRRDRFVSRLSKVEGLEVLPPGGAFYLWVNARGWIGKSYDGQKIPNDKELSMVLLEKAQLAVVPGSESGVEGYLRLSFALDEESIAKACTRFEEFARKLK